MKRRRLREKRVSRRRFLGGCAASAAGLARWGAAAGTARAAPPYDKVNTDQYLEEVHVVVKVEDQEVFTEGPAVDRMGNVFFTNVPASKILMWSPRSEKLSVFRTGTNKTNGLLFDRQGRLLACEGGAGRVTRTWMQTGRIEVLADSYQGKRFAAPNDLCLDQQGRVYFTSRTGAQDVEGENPKGVYRIDPDGSVVPILQWPRIHMPNGIVTSPDDKMLYVIEAHPDADHHRDLRAYNLRPDGTVNGERVVVDFYPGRSGDGMAMDEQGNLYVAAGLHQRRDTSETLDTRPGIHVFSPEGKLLAYRQTPEDTITNCTFGGADLQTLYVTCGTLLLALRTKIPGKRSYRPDA